MDHLPWRYTDRPKPAIPNLCQNLDESDLCPDHESFSTWPQTQQRNLARSDDLRSIATRCQSWLFLGLASIIAREHRLPILVTHLISAGDPDLINTRGITNAFLHLKWNGKDSTRLTETVTFAQYQMLEWFASVEGSTAETYTWAEETFNVFWSTACFLEWLLNQVQGQSERSVHGVELAKYINSQSFITDRIRQAGRCPTVLRRKALTLLETWALLSIPMRHSVEVKQALLHRTCVGRRCNAFHVDEITYRTQHADDCESHNHCRLRRIAADALNARIKNGVIPIIRSTIDHKGLQIDIVDGDKVDEFTAISHVWAGGLGNFDDNSVYECQLESIHRTLSSSRSLRSTVYYWLDTLCIPVGHQGNRKEAIDDMARVYASAHTVHVLDPILQNTKANRLTSGEKAVLIAASPWMARSWTFQEAALAVRLQFQFSDVVVSLREVDVQGSPLSSSQLQILWHRDVDRLEGGTFYNITSAKYFLANFYAILISARLIPRKLQSRQILKAAKGVTTPVRLTSEESLSLAWKELFQRDSTKIDDVATIIAVFIGRSAKEILNLKPEERTVALLSSLPSLPVWLFFSPTADSSTGNWCPVLPTCNTEYDTIATASNLRWNDQSMLKLADGHDICLNHLSQPLDFLGKHTLPLDSAEYYGQVEITFSEPKPPRGKRFTPEEHDIVLVLPKNILETRVQQAY